MYQKSKKRKMAASATFASAKGCDSVQPNRHFGQFSSTSDASTTHGITANNCGTSEHFLMFF